MLATGDARGGGDIAVESDEVQLARHRERSAFYCLFGDGAMMR